ncbi:hypothetical protein [Enterococcus sp. DIV0806c]|uniref:hypothetical protein n=1 Tax=Enterococcus sp. DIV0806c TaxID=2774869 RepID=UPI003F287185
MCYIHWSEDGKTCIFCGEPTPEKTKKKAMNQREGEYKMHLVKLNNGLYIDDKRIDYLTDVDIKSNVDNLSEVTIKLICKVDGLDNIVNPNPYMFEAKEPKKPYKPSRKYRSH